MSHPASTHEFLANLSPHAGKPLIFELGGKQIQAGYHVTEIMTANVQALDCGAKLETWQETVVQLWDVPGKEGETHMSAGKFLSIYDKVAARLKLDRDVQLVFEAGDSTGPAIRYTAENLDVKDGAVVVRLTPIQATCKPRDRWLASLGVTAARGCCSPQTVPVSSGGEQTAAGCCSEQALPVAPTSRNADTCCG